jgi:hypothetical protein
VPGIDDDAFLVSFLKSYSWFLSRNHRARSSDRVFVIAVGLLLDDDGVSSDHTVSLGKEIMRG